MYQHGLQNDGDTGIGQALAPWLSTQLCDALYKLRRSAGSERGRVTGATCPSGILVVYWFSAKQTGWDLGKGGLGGDAWGLRGAG